jgi:hypothetical protein
MFEKAFKNVCTSTVVVPPGPLPPTPSTSWAVMTPGKTEEDSEHPEPAYGEILTEYSSD